MAEPESKITETQDSQTGRDSFNGIDPLLDSLVAMAENGIELTVTLFVRGAVVAGRLISFQAYLEGIARQIETLATGDREIAQTLADAYRSGFQRFLQGKEAGGVLEDLHPPYIHLAEAKFLSGGQLIPTSQGVFWRGRLADIDGFSFNSLSSP